MNRSPAELALFREEFKALQGNYPFPWQERLFLRFCHGEFPTALDLPTGLGKTSVMAIWLLARAHADEAVLKSIPRRLVYVVDRRVVVDQATTEAEKIRASLDALAQLKARLGLAEESPLPISTLRGQHTDNRDWLVDPTSPAIIVGTVDMVGSRLLFSGYGVSPKLRPYQGGFLGADTLVVLDEAHLVPPFERLLEFIERGADVFGPETESDRRIVPPFRLLSLSATGRDREGGVFRLDGADLQHEIVKRRLNAKKSVRICKADGRKLEVMLAEQAWALAGNGSDSARCLIYCDSRDTAERTRKEIQRLKGGAKKAADVIKPELLVGARRAKERQDAEVRLKQLGFLAGSNKKSEGAVFLIATSAGEVGIDLDADHMVCDLVPWERMVQRLCRVNRRGDGDAKVVVIDQGEPKPKNVAQPTSKEERDHIAYHSLSVIEHLSDRERGADASPGALMRLKARGATDKGLESTIRAATTPEPLRPPLTRALADAWSMTSLEEHAGRPDIQPWLRGWIDEDEVQTAIVWREHLPVHRNGRAATAREINDFFEAAPPHISEVLETETRRVVDWLLQRAATVLKRLHKDEENNAVSPQNRRVLFVLNSRGRIDDDDGRRRYSMLGALAELDTKDRRRERDAFEKSLRGCTIVLSGLLGGLNVAGMLDADFDGVPPTIDAHGIDAEEIWPSRPFAVQEAITPKRVAGKEWKESNRLVIETDESGEAIRWLVVYEHCHQAETEDVRAVSPAEQRLQSHRTMVEHAVRLMAQTFRLPSDYVRALAISARLHDEGKKFWRWQRAFNAPRRKGEDGAPEIFAKTRGPVNTQLLDGYRHEFGSLPYVEEDAEFKLLPVEHQDLALHLVAAHHGNARPLISAQSSEGFALAERTRDVALRFARLQKRWGPWGLAWWEALLRAADQQASRKNDEAASAPDLVGNSADSIGEAA
jgi:CRISPR-associated endonuclease/helicase Cas3